MGTTSSFSFPLLIGTPISRSSKPRLVVAAAASSEGGATSSATKLLTFLGKGGSGKTTAAILAAQVPFSPSITITNANSCHISNCEICFFFLLSQCTQKKKKIGLLYMCKSEVFIAEQERKKCLSKKLASLRLKIAIGLIAM